MAKRTGLDFEAMLANGENPNGFTAQTNNGTAHATGAGWNQDTWDSSLKADGERWNGRKGWSEDDKMLGGWGPGANRTGE